MQSLRRTPRSRRRRRLLPTAYCTIHCPRRYTNDTTVLSLPPMLIDMAYGFSAGKLDLAVAGLAGELQHHVGPPGARRWRRWGGRSRTGRRSCWSALAVRAGLAVEHVGRPPCPVRPARPPRRESMPEMVKQSCTSSRPSCAGLAMPAMPSPAPRPRRVVSSRVRSAGSRRQVRPRTGRCRRSAPPCPGTPSFFSPSSEARIRRPTRRRSPWSSRRR